MPGMTLSAGRSPSNDIVIPDSYASRSVALFSAVKAVVILRDLNSVNGVFVNGKIVSHGNSVKLEDGDIIKFSKGPYQIEFHNLRKHE
jgi:pSer/pThr/pTyr-binding forkhead associated (FHA) protein